MNVYSMTGYASALVPTPRSARERGAEARSGSTLVVEMRSVNGRFLDLAFKLGEESRAFEPALRDLLCSALRRGKVELRMQLRAGPSDAEDSTATVDPQRLQSLKELQQQVLAELPHARPLSVQEALAWCRPSAAESTLEHGTVLGATKQCLAQLLESRAREGDKLVADLRSRLAALQALVLQAQPLLPQAVHRQRQRFLERWREAAQMLEGAAADPQAMQERALQEAAAFAVRIDVAEELARLSAHIQEIEHLLTRGGEVGKRLDFLIQELHREANTLGSKSSMLDLSAISVEMRVLIEQMREQVQNIE